MLLLLWSCQTSINCLQCSMCEECKCSLDAVQIQWDFNWSLICKAFSKNNSGSKCDLQVLKLIYWYSLSLFFVNITLHIFMFMITSFLDDRKGGPWSKGAVCCRVTWNFTIWVWSFIIFSIMSVAALILISAKRESQCTIKAFAYDTRKLELTHKPSAIKS